VLLAIPATIYMCRNDRVRGDDAPLRCQRRSERAFQLYAPPSVSVGLQDSLCMCLIVSWREKWRFMTHSDVAIYQSASILQTPTDAGQTLLQGVKVCRKL